MRFLKSISFLKLQSERTKDKHKTSKRLGYMQDNAEHVIRGKECKQWDYQCRGARKTKSLVIA